MDNIFSKQIETGCVCVCVFMGCCDSTPQCKSVEVLLMFLGNGLVIPRYIYWSALLTLTVADGNQSHYLE